MIRVLVWNEYVHEKKDEGVKKIYSNGLHNAIDEFLRCDDVEVKTATLDENGIPRTSGVVEYQKDTIDGCASIRKGV